MVVVLRELKLQGFKALGVRASGPWGCAKLHISWGGQCRNCLGTAWG